MQSITLWGSTGTVCAEEAPISMGRKWDLLNPAATDVEGLYLNHIGEQPVTRKLLIEVPRQQPAS
ncbi:MAG: hypothetical protein V7776_15800 [Halopseudomonas aestusnigri]